MSVYEHKTMKITILFNSKGELQNVALPKFFDKADKIDWDGIKHQIPFLESEIDESNWNLINVL